VLLTIQNALGIVNVFSVPLPLLPKTSIGLITGIEILLVVILGWIYLKKKNTLKTHFFIADCLIILYLFIQMTSLILAPVITQPSTVRLLFIACLQYFIYRFFVFTKKEIQIILMGVAATCLFLTFISVFQVFFKDLAIYLSRQYFFGDAAYGIVWELLRGRVPHWGNLILAFPFLFSFCIFLLVKKPFFRPYVLISIILLLFSFLVSNFRWMTICFFFGSLLFFILLLKKQIFTRINIFIASITVFMTIIISFFLTSTVFHYNLIDRFFLQDKDRDITNSLGRLYLYQQALDVFLLSPLIGVGSGNYGSMVDPIIGVDYNIPLKSVFSEIDRQPVSSHNEALTVLAEGGILSFFIIIYLNVVIGQKIITIAFSSSKTPLLQQLVILSLALSLIMYWVYGLFENISPNNLVFLFFVYGSSVSLIQKEYFS